MKKWIRNFKSNWTLSKYILVGALAIVIVLASLGLYFSSYNSTRLNGYQNFTEIKENVKVYFDEWGIPHIFAENNKDAFFALGYITASERLFQMEMGRRLGSGTLSELFGEKTLKHDKLFRTLGFRRVMEQNYDKQWSALPTEAREMVTQYLAGLNKFVIEGDTPLEFLVLGIEKRPFNYLDILSFTGYMSFSFSYPFRVDPLFTQMLINPTIDTEMVEEIRGSGRLNVVAAKNLHIPKFLAAKPLDGLPAFSGSNSFVIAGKRSANGKPMLANDPHIRFSNPGPWFEAHIRTPSLDLYGHYLPLVPFPPMAHTRTHGHALTISHSDDLDFYSESLDASGEQALYEGEYYPLKKYNETIKVKGEDDIELTVKESRHGPLLIDVNEERLKGIDQALSVRWSYYHPENFMIKSFYLLMKADTLGAFKEAVQYGAAPGLNLSYANTEGDIAWWMMGKVPIRPADYPTGDFILDGTKKTYDYLGWYSIDENPHQVNPRSGIIVSANGIPPRVIKPLSGYWDNQDRYQRMYKQLEKRSDWTLDDLKNVQTDITLDRHNEYVQLLLNLVDKDKLKDYSLLSLMKGIYDWDGRTKRTSWETLLFHQWIDTLTIEIYRGKLSKDQLENLCTLPHAWSHLVRMLKNTQSSWWPKKAEALVTETLENSVAHLREKWGKDYLAWKWGDEHTLSVPHAFAKNPLVKPFFTVGPAPVDGSFNIVNNTKYQRCSSSFEVIIGASTRSLVDFAMPEKSLGILPTGNSGRVGNPHYQDQWPLYVDNLYRFQYMDLGDLEGIFLTGEDNLFMMIPVRGN